MHLGIHISRAGTLALLILTVSLGHARAAGSGLRERLVANAVNYAPAASRGSGYNLAPSTPANAVKTPAVGVSERSAVLYRQINSLVFGSRSGERKVIEVAQASASPTRQTVPGAVPHASLHRMSSMGSH